MEGNSSNIVIIDSSDEDSISDDEVALISNDNERFVADKYLVSLFKTYRQKVEQEGVKKINLDLIRSEELKLVINFAKYT